jgi:hypothetical protein
MPGPNTLFAAGVIAATMCVTACSSSTQTPSMPEADGPALSAAPTPSPRGPGSATVSGSLTGMTSSAASIRPAAAVTITVAITGTGLSTTVAPGGTFILNGVPAGNIELHFSGAGVDDRTTIADVADDEQIHIVVTVSGSRAVVSVTDREKPAKGVELEGLIASINLGARTLVVNGTTVSVPAAATIRHGDTRFNLADLKVGQRVHVKGTASGSTVVASDVMVQDENPKPPDEGETEAEGTVSGLGGTCPSLVFTVHSTRVSTTASTQFVKGTCGQLTNGTSVEVEGARQSDGSITAAKVRFDK